MRVTIVDVPDDDGPDPWPFWGRTSSRLGRTATIGPHTPHVAWTANFTETGLKAYQLALNRDGMLLVGRSRGVALIDTAQRQLLWDTWSSAAQGGAIAGDNVYWATSSPDTSIYCSNINTGESQWSYQGQYGFNTATPVVSDAGVLYVPDGLGTMFARMAEDGEELWTRTIGTQSGLSPSLASATTLGTGGGSGGYDYLSLDPASGETQWSFPTGRWLYGVTPVLGDRIYVASADRYLYYLDRFTGEEIWRVWCEQIQDGAAAVGHDGTICTATEGNEGLLVAVSPDGEQLWRLPLPGVAYRQPPIVAGDGTICLTCTRWTGSTYLGYVLAVRPDGTILWQRELDDAIRGSPILGPDGTLYVGCNDGKIYAFKDVIPGDVNADGKVDQFDLAALLAAYGTCAGDDCFIHSADFNHDNCIDQADLAILLASYGS